MYSNANIRKNRSIRVHSNSNIRECIRIRVFKKLRFSNTFELEYSKFMNLRNHSTKTKTDDKNYAAN